MTTAKDIESSDHGARPIELYKFEGTYASYLYTSASHDVEFNNEVYAAIPGLTRSEITIESESSGSNDLKAKVPNSTQLVSDYGLQITPPVLEITLIRIYEGYSENINRVLWKGKVTALSLDGNMTTVTSVSNLVAAQSSSVPTFYYQAPCNHSLYDSGCKVSRAANSVDTFIAGMGGGGLVMTLNTYGIFSPSDFLAGELVHTVHNERRMVVAADDVAGTITVNYPFSSARVSSPVQVARGCNHAWDGDCKNKFNNTINYGGHPFIPSENMFDGEVS